MRGSLALCVALVLVGGRAAGQASLDVAPLPVCLAPRANSCDQRSKKDRGAHYVVPRLRSTVLTLFSEHTREAVALGAVPGPGEAVLLERFFRDRTSWELHPIAPRCMATIRRVCVLLAGRRVEVISGYRSDKLNEMLRKKGHHVAQRSQHTEGHAVDFRVVGVPARELYRVVRRIHVGGVGLYPESAFVLVDAGPERTWHGE